MKFNGNIFCKLLMTYMKHLTVNVGFTLDGEVHKAPGMIPTLPDLRDPRALWILDAYKGFRHVYEGCRF